MRNAFSLLAFLCKVPADLLEEYAEHIGLTETPLGSCIPWRTIEALEADRRSMAVVRQAIVEAPDAVRDQIMQDFMDVDALADGRGIEYLLITGRCQPEPVDLALHLSHYAGSQAKALFALLEFPEVFTRALRFAHVESFGESRWHKTGRIEGAQPQVTERSQEQLRLAISNYSRLQGRGTGCTVDVEDRGDDLYVFVYPEDYTRRRMVYNAQRDLIVETFRPAFEVIYVYHRPAQTLEIYVGGGSGDREAMKRYFGRAILGVELGLWSGARRVYQLEHLKYATSTFPVMPTDEVVAVRLKRLSFLDTAGAETREITLASRCEQNPNDLYAYLEQVVTESNLSLAQLAVARASFQLVFQRRQDHGRQVTRSFTLAVPNTHTYRRNDPFAPKIQELLTRWKIDVAHDTSELVSPA
ncbi:MAG: hypothetical protein ACYDBB_01295 [Armatimonadota bacterium]